MDFVTSVEEFYRAFDQPQGELPKPLTAERLRERESFLREEFEEYQDAITADNFTEQVDGLVDIIYIAIGTLIEMGVPIRSVFDEIHKSNMRKLNSDGNPIIEGGKIRKPQGWTGPDLDKALKATPFAEWALSEDALLDEIADASEEAGKAYDQGYDDGHNDGYKAAEDAFSEGDQ